MSDPSGRFGRLSISTDQSARQAQQAFYGSRQQQFSKSSNSDIEEALREDYGTSMSGPSHFSVSDRAFQVRDILSTFSRSVLPSDYLRPEFPTITRSRTDEECNVPLDLEATIFRLAVNNPAVYDALSHMQPPAACAEIFYSKVRRNVGELMAKLDDYLQHGPSTDTTSGSLQIAESSSQFLAMTAEDLKENVSQVAMGILMRSPHGLRTALDCLLHILNAAGSRNRDMFEEIPWERIVPADEEDWERNFWELCLRNPDVTTTAGRSTGSTIPAKNEEEDYFVLDTLMRLPNETLAERIQLLQSFRDQLEEDDVDPEYLGRFDEVLAKAAPAAQVSHVQQTPGPSGATSRAQTPRTTSTTAAKTTTGTATRGGTTTAGALRGRARARRGGGETTSTRGKAVRKRRALSSSGSETSKRGGAGGGGRGGKRSK